MLRPVAWSKERSMAEVIAKGEVREVSIEAVITRADGTVEDLGVISTWRAEDETDESVKARLTAEVKRRLGRA
jgi:hypothetical protein